MTELLHDDHPLLDERLRAADPARELATWTDAETEALLSRITPPDAAPTRARRSRSVWARAAVLSAAAILTLALMLFPGFGFLRGGATAAASDLLSRAQLSAVDPPARGDQYWKVTTASIANAIIGEGEFGEPGTVSSLRHVKRVKWVPVDGSRPSWFLDRVGPHVRQVSGPATDLPDVGWSTTEVWTSNVAVRADGYDLTRLPRNATALKAVLYANALGRGSGLDAQVVDDVATILREGYADAALRQALFEVLKGVPGVDLLDDNVTLDGRRGIALGLTEPSGRARQLIFDQGDGSYIGERFVWGFGIDAVNEDAVTRELVDVVDPEVVSSAVRYECGLDGQGLMMCRKP